jgi:[ribosomal protein S5]-alanine N-acetyltransferase
VIVVAETARLLLRRLVHADDAFVLRLLSEPSFLRHIGDRGVRTLDGARSYLDDGPLASYREHGFGLFLVALRETPSTAIGLCGLLRREGLAEPDLGFALLPEYTGHGYAVEAGRAVVALARDQALQRLLAIVSPDNAASMAVLRRLGFQDAGMVRLTPDAAPLVLFELSFMPDQGVEGRQAS